MKTVAEILITLHIDWIVARKVPNQMPAMLAHSNLFGVAVLTLLTVAPALLILRRASRLSNFF